jgi:hypothetical protein
MPRHTLAEIEYAYKELQWAWRLTLDMDVQDWNLLSRIHAELARLERPLRLHRRLQ